MTIPVNKNSLEMFPSKLSAMLSSWQPATFEEFQVTNNLACKTAVCGETN